MIKVSENFNRLLYYQNLLYIIKTIKIKLVNQYYSNLLIDYLEFKKTYKFIARDYYLSNFCYNIKKYFFTYNINLASKMVIFKLYSNF